MHVAAIDDFAQFEGAGITHLLSITSPGTSSGHPVWFDGVHRDVFFDDVTSRREASVLQVRGPTADDVKSILSFGSALVSGDCVLVHCEAGISRSTAAAYAILCQELGAGHERRALDEVLAARPSAYPNRWVVQLADEILARGGRMLEALDSLSERCADSLNA